MINRRHFLGAAAAGTAGLALPFRTAHAAVSASDRKFIFVFNNGGWDPTRVFAPEFDNANVDMEPGAQRGTAGGIDFVDHPDRPSVRAFIEQNHDRMLVINGVQVRSIAHEICTMIALTGNTSGLAPDWATILAAGGGASLTLPHLVLGGPSFTGPLGTSSARTGAAGQLEGLLSGDLLDASDQPVGRLPQPYTDRIDRFLQRRSGAEVQGARGSVRRALTGAYDDALAKALGLKDYRWVMDFSGGTGLAEQAQVAADALALALSRCVSVGYPGAGAGLGWDSHAQNDDTQSALFEGLFNGLGQLVEVLRSTPGEVADTLAEETVVVVLSEMGRTPRLNATAGKDHWPYTSVMILGDGITGDRVVGGYDEGYAGLAVDPASAEVSSGGPVLSVESVGAALLELGGEDPGQWLNGFDPLRGVLS
jgi:hypothetical protein